MLYVWRDTVQRSYSAALQRRTVRWKVRGANGVARRASGRCGHTAGTLRAHCGSSCGIAPCCRPLRAHHPVHCAALQAGAIPCPPVRAPTPPTPRDSRLNHQLPHLPPSFSAPSPLTPPLPLLPRRLPHSSPPPRPSRTPAPREAPRAHAAAHRAAPPAMSEPEPEPEPGPGPGPGPEPGASTPWHDGCYCFRTDQLDAARAAGQQIRCGGDLKCACFDPTLLPSTFPADFPDLESTDWDAIIDPLVDIPSPNAPSDHRKRPRSHPSSCQCPCAARHVAEAVIAAKQRRCCGPNCTCALGDCKCPQNPVPTALRCCGDSDPDVVAENVAITLSMNSPHLNPSQPANPHAASCCQPSPARQTDPLAVTTPPQTPSFFPHPYPPTQPRQPSASVVPALPDQQHPLIRPPVPVSFPHTAPSHLQPPLASCANTPPPAPFPSLSPHIITPPHCLPNPAPLNPILPPPSSALVPPLPETQQLIQIPTSRCSSCAKLIPSAAESPPREPKTTSTVLAQLYPPTTSALRKQPNGIHPPAVASYQLLVPEVTPKQSADPTIDSPSNHLLVPEEPSDTSTQPSTGDQPNGTVPQPTARACRFKKGTGRRRSASLPNPKGAASASTTSAPSMSSTPSDNGEERSRQFACSQCPSTFFFKQNRDRHVNEVHLGHRPHKCNFAGCDSAFKNRSGLKQHARTVHEKARPYKCTQCHSAFGQRNHLTQHVLVVHEKVKMYKCELCSMTFSNVGNRTQHMKRRHPQKVS